ncbi:MAG: hypothetical protein HYT94_00270 [Parcubacteria group bacterium]|nr:hypothetical protein [Parcubacteria group bacterium]
MFKLDFSEAKEDWRKLRVSLVGGQPDASGSDVKNLPGALVAKLDTKDTVMWVIFATVSVSSTAMILLFIDSFSVEQEKYQTVLTSVGRSPAEYRAIMAETDTGTSTLKP